MHILKKMMLCFFASLSFSQAQADATYHASSFLGGSGTAGCTGSTNCTNESWGIDLNDSTGYQWNIEGGAGGKTDVFVQIAVPSGSRAMSLWVNSSRIGVISSNASESPRPKGKEFGPYAIDLNTGINSIELRDTEGTAEFDVHHARIAANSGPEVFIQVDKAEDFLFLYVNGIEKMRWVRGTVNDTNQTNQNDPTVTALGRKINITHLLADGENEIRLAGSADNWYSLDGGYDVRLWSGDQLLIDSEQDFLQGGNYPGIFYEETVNVTTNSGRGRHTLTVGSNVGGEAIYINNIYTGRRAPATFELASGEYLVGLGEYTNANGTALRDPDWWNDNGVSGQYFEQAVTVNNQDIAIERSAMPRISDIGTWNVGVITYTNMHTVDTVAMAEAGVAADPGNIGVLSNDDITVAAAVIEATGDLLHEMSYGLANWNITLLPSVTDRTYRAMDRNDAINLYREVVEIPQDLMQYDLILHVMPDETANGTPITDDFNYALGGRPNLYLPASWADAPGASIMERLNNVRPSPGLLHEALHNYDNSRLVDYNGVNQLHGAGEHGYSDAAPDCHEWLCFYGDYITSQVPEDTSVLSQVARSAPVDDVNASTFAGIFNLIRSGSGADRITSPSTIRNVARNNCLDVSWGSVLDGADILMWGCHGADNQRWSFKHVAHNTFNLINENSLKCATFTNGTIIQDQCQTELRSLFMLSDLPNGNFQIQAMDGSCLSLNSADELIFENCNPDIASQEWTFN